MAFYNFGSPVACNCCCDYSTFSPCCNTSVSLDGRYHQQHFQEVYYAPEPPPQIEVVRQRLPVPPPDVIDRVLVVPQPKKYIYQVVEIPTKPPPVVQQRVVHQPPNPTLCGGTYNVQVPHNSPPSIQGLVQNSSSVQLSPSYVQTAAPTVVQVAPSHIPYATMMHSSPNIIAY